MIRVFSGIIWQWDREGITGSMVQSKEWFWKILTIMEKTAPSSGQEGAELMRETEKWIIGWI